MFKKIAILSGAFKNGGDYFITLRGKEILEKYIPEFEFEILLRDDNLNLKNFDGAIILGGPIVSEKLHKQSKSIIKELIIYKIPVFSLGIGINGKGSSIKNFKFDKESIKFWKNVYKKTSLVSVRDKYTQTTFKKIGVKAFLTGCPTLSVSKKNKANENILINIPNLKLFFLTRFKEFISTIYLLHKINKIKPKGDIGTIFPHGISSIGDKIMKSYIKILGFEVYDYSKKSFDEGNIDKFYINVGPRLHTHIYYLTYEKPSYLLNLDLRTYAFSETITSFPRYNFNFSGINKLTKKLKKDIKKDDFKFLKEFKKEQKIYEKEMKNFILKIKKYYKN